VLGCSKVNTQYEIKWINMSVIFQHCDTGELFLDPPHFKTTDLLTTEWSPVSYSGPDTCTC